MADASVTIKAGNVSGQTMHTREKIGNLCKRLLCSIIENKKNVQSIKEMVGVIGGDTRKVIDLVFILEGLGLITRISKNTLVYTGFRGITQRFLEFVQYKLKKTKTYDQHFRLMNEDLNLGGKGTAVKSSIYMGKFVLTIVCTLLFDTNKNISRGEVDAIYEEYSQYFKDSSSKNIINDIINLLIALNFIEKNEGNDSLTWTGPDCINSIGLNNSNVYDIENLDDILKSKTINYDAKELSYFKILLKDEITGNKMILKPENFNKDQQAESYKKDPNSNLNLYPFSSFEQGGYALLKGKTWQYLMTKPYAVIGRAASNKDSSNKKYKWEVDVDLATSSSVSRQHAVILYNYEEECFEIKCLSKKNPVKVGDYSYDFKDKACPITSKTLITLGGESFYFYLPNIPLEEPQEIEKKKEQTQEGEASVKEEEEEKEIKEEDPEERIKLEDDGDDEEGFVEVSNKKMDENMDEEDDEDDDEEEDDDDNDNDNNENENENGEVMELE